MVQPVCGSPTMLGKSPPSPSKAHPEWLEAKKAASSRRRTTSSTRHRYASVHVCKIKKRSHTAEMLKAHFIPQTRHG